MSVKVKFKNVGGGKMTWETVLPDLEYRTLLKAVKKRGALCSRFPEFAVDDDGTGTIFAGFRCVGTFEWQNERRHTDCIDHETAWEKIADGIRWFLIWAGMGIFAGITIYGCSYLQKSMQ